MNLLISAYACRPNMGSEPAVGWNWILELSKYHQLTVLTNFTNRPYIEEYKQRNKKISGVQFIYVRPDPKLTFWYKEWERFERIYYYIWQKKALLVARKIQENNSFDAVQHLTYVTCIMPTYMHKLGIPFIYGPISGGERIPRGIGLPMTRKEKITELVRGLTLLIPKFSLNTHIAFKKAEKIIVVTNDTKKLIPKKYESKIELCQAISLSEKYFKTPVPVKGENRTTKILIAGRMLAWKGFDLGIDAVRRILDQGLNIELTVLGSGNEEFCKHLKEKAGKYLGKEICFVEKVDYNKMINFYDQFDILLNCSLRDSGCLVVMEAMGRGLPIICINTGGPAVNTNETCAIKVSPAPYNQLVQKLEKAILELSLNKDKRLQMSNASRVFAEEHFTTKAKIIDFLHIYDEVTCGDK